MVSDHLIADLNMLKKCLVFYNMIGGEQNIDNLNLDKINSINFFKFKRELKPVLSKDDPFDLDVAKKTVIVFLKEISKLNSNEIEFVSNFKEGIRITVESANNRPVREVTLKPERSYMENSRITAFISLP